MSNVLDIRAGSAALARIRDEGLPQRNIEVLVGASGGPKWFVLSGLDKALLKHYFHGRQQPLHLLGTSSGCWRFSCYGQNDALAAHKRLEQGYLHQNYSDNATAKEVTEKAWLLLNAMIPDHAVGEILDNPVMRLHLICNRSHGLCQCDNKAGLLAGLGVAALTNLVNRQLLGLSFSRTLFYHSELRPPFYSMDDLPTERVALSQSNLKKAVMASGSIPMVMEGIRDIKGAAKGVYRDGGITDYHFDMRFNSGEGLVLYPHFYSRMIPGWFDKRLKWRRPSSLNCRNLVLVSPSSDFVKALPYGKIPDRNDFKAMDYDTRVAYWKQVIKASDQLGETFLELVSSGKVRQEVKPIY